MAELGRIMRRSRAETLRAMRKNGATMAEIRVETGRLMRIETETRWRALAAMREMRVEMDRQDG
jgi:hypothetical protein